MGCGASNTSGAFSAQLEKDPEDYIVDELNMKRLNIAQFDSWFDSFEDPVNSIIGMSNNINDSINEIKQTAAEILGAYKVSVNTDQTSVDSVLLDFTNADGSRPSPEAVAALLGNPDVSNADEALTAALNTLLGSLSSQPANTLKADDSGISAETTTAELTAFNAALAAFKAAVGPAYKVFVVAKNTPAAGAPVWNYTIQKTILDDDDIVIKPVTLLEIAKTKSAEAIISAQSVLQDQLAGLAAAAKDTDVSYSLHKTRVVCTVSSADSDKVAAVKKAAAAANQALFNLSKAANNINGEVNIVKAVVTVVETVKTKLLRLGYASAEGLLKVDPSVNMLDDGSFDFDLGLSVEGFEFPGGLNAKVQELINCILHISDEVKECAGQFPGLNDKVQGLVSESKDVFANPMSAFTDAGLDMLSASRAVAALSKNVTTIGGATSLVAIFPQTTLRVADQLKQAVAELSAMAV